MLKVDTTLNHIPAGREHVIALFESINQPLVNIPTFGTAPTGAFVLGTRNEYGYYTVFVYLFQTETRAVVIYISEPRNLGPEQYRTEEQEAVRFVESMGFMIDNIYFPTLAASEQEAVIARIPMFRPPPPQAFQPPPRSLPQASRFPPQPAPMAPDPRLGTFGSDAMFGGLTAQDGDVFRRAGFEGQGMAPAIPSQGAAGPMSSPGLSGMPLSNQSGTFADGFSSGFQDMPRFQLPQSNPTAIPQALPGPSHPKETQPSVPLDRIGRLLGAFVVLLGVELMSCQSGGTALTIQQSKEIESHIDLGNQHLIRGQVPEAIQAFDIVLDLEEDNRDALRGKGLAFLKLGRVEQAEAFYRDAIASDPTWSEPKNELSLILVETHRCDEAEVFLREVLKDIFYKTPEYAEHNLAKAVECQGRPKESLEILEGLVLKRPTFCLGYLTLAQLAHRTKRHDVTIEACDSFFTNCEQNEEIKEQISADHSAMCYFYKGLGHGEMGDVESARACFLRCQSSGTYGKECRRSLNMLPP